MKINLPAIIFLGLFITFLTACSKKDKLPDAGGNTLSKTEFFNASQQSAGSLQFMYDGQNRLTAIISSTGGRELFGYNAQGGLTLYTVANNATDIIFMYLYSYDASGRIIKSTGMPVLPNLLLDDYSYTYDASGRVIADSVYTLGRLVAYSNYQYDNNNNVSGYEHFTKSGTSFQTDGLITITYDNKINPYGQSGSLLFYTEGDYHYLSKANFVSEKKGQTILTPANYFTDKYYSNGLLRSRAISGATGGTTIYTYKQP